MKGKTSNALPELLTINEVSAILKCTPTTLRNWDKKGLLNPIRIGHRKARRYSKDQIEKFLKIQSFKPENYKNTNPDVHFPLVVGASPEPVLITDSNINIFYVNKAWEKLTGYKFSEVKGKNPRILSSGKTPKVEYEKLWKALKKGKTYISDAVIDKRKDGSEYQIHSMFFPFKGDSKKTYYVQMQHDITATKKREEEALRQREELFSKVFMSGPMAMSITRLSDDVWIDVNENFLHLTGYNRHEVIGHSASDLNLSIEKEDVHENSQRISKQPTLSKLPNSIFRIRTKKGAIKKVQSSPVVVKINNKRHVITLYNDITEQIKAQEQLKKSEERFRNAMDNMIEGCQIIGFDWCYIYINDAAEKQNKRPREDLIGKIYMDIWPEIESTRVFRVIKKCLEKREPKILENKFVFPDGTTGYFDLRIEPVPEGVFILSSDITEKKKAEVQVTKLHRRLQEKIHELETLIELVPVGIGISDNAKGKRITVNKTFREILNSNKEQNVSKTAPLKERPLYKVLQNGKEIPDKELPMQKAGTTGKPVYNIEIDLRHPDGKTFSLLSSAIPIFDEKNRVRKVVGTFLDVTEMKNLEKQKDEFLAVASHELKTPVTSIKAYSQVMQALFKKKGDEKSVEILQKMESQINKITALINDLLDVTRIEAGKLQFRPKYFDINELIKEVVREIQLTTTQHKIELKLAKSKKIFADRDRIDQVINNLLSNAVKYSPHAKKIIVSTQVTLRDLTVTVQDFGNGIPEGKINKLFERFYRIDGGENDTYPGLGLGLYISAEIVKRHNGTIWVNSRMGKGSTFSFKLPIQSTVEDNMKKGVKKRE